MMLRVPVESLNIVKFVNTNIVNFPSFDFLTSSLPEKAYSEEEAGKERERESRKRERE